MPAIVNLRHLEKKGLRIEGEVTVEELDVENFDELISIPGPLRYSLDVERLGATLLLQGDLELDLACECARCLKPFNHKVVLRDWVCSVPLEGEERVPIVNDCVDLTPILREDILLAFPQHPSCGTECSGLPVASPARDHQEIGDSERAGGVSSAWAELNKLKF